MVCSAICWIDCRGNGSVLRTCNGFDLVDLLQITMVILGIGCRRKQKK